MSMYVQSIDRADANAVLQLGQAGAANVYEMRSRLADKGLKYV